MKTSLIVFTGICLIALGIGTFEASKHLGHEWRPTKVNSVRYETEYRIKTTRAAYPVLHYTYTVDGHTYSGADRNLTGTRYRSADDAKAAVLSAYDINHLTVYYEATAPELSDLNPVDEATAWSYIYIPILIMIGGGILAYLGPKLKLNELFTSTHK